jgi:integrase
VVLVLEATGMRVGELESLRWGDLDAAGCRWRVARQNEKGKRGRWVPVPADLFEAVEELVPREDRDLESTVLPWLRQANLRREIARDAKATGTPLWSPHDLRHRRISLWHRQGVSWAQIGEWAGQRDLATTANVYSHVVLGREIERAGLVRPPWSRDQAGSPSETFRR